MSLLCRAIGAAEAAAPAMAALGSYQRKGVLEHCVAAFKDRFEELAMSLCIEAGKAHQGVCWPHTFQYLYRESGQFQYGSCQIQPKILTPNCRLNLIPFGCQTIKPT